ncbi:MAG: hypothetical protein ACYSX0_14340 [Planctomycetota bacterium]|jgi:hypothetical protein
MKSRILLLVLLLAIAAVWAWAFAWPKPIPPLPAAYRGSYLLYRFEPPPGVGMNNPYPAGQERHFTFREDGTFSINVHLSEGYEMMRQEGVIEVEETDRVTLTQISENRKETPHIVRKFRARWGQDKTGRYLHFTGDPEPYELFFRPISELPPPEKTEKPTDEGR